MKSHEFTIRKLKNTSIQHEVILSGTTFGWLDFEHIFDLSLKGVPEPLVIEFKLSVNQNARESKLKVSGIMNNMLKIHFISNRAFGPVAPTKPFNIISIDDSKLNMMFFADLMSESECYRITYEFYQENK